MPNKTDHQTNQPKQRKSRGKTTKPKASQKPETSLQPTPYSVLLSISMSVNQVGFNQLLWYNY